jgi:hypothetical protein
MSWTSYHRRADVLRAVVAAADARRDGVLPTCVPGVRAVFADDAELLGALQLKWHTRLAGRIEREQLAAPVDLRAAVVAAYRATARELPGIRAVLDAHRASVSVLPADLAEVVHKSSAKERMMLASTAGLASPGDPRGVRVGERIEADARVAVPRAPVGSRSLVERLRALLPAA